MLASALQELTQFSSCSDMSKTMRNKVVIKCQYARYEGILIGPTDLVVTSLNLLTVHLITILYTRLHKLISRKSHNSFKLVFLGISEM